MTDDHTLGRLAKLDIPAPRPAARESAVAAAMHAFAQEKVQHQTQGIAAQPRLTHRILNLWGKIMDRKLLSTSALAGILALPLAGYTAFYLMKENPIALESAPVAATPAYAPEPVPVPAPEPAVESDAGVAAAYDMSQMQQEVRRQAQASEASGVMDKRERKMVAQQPAVAPVSALQDVVVAEETSSDRVQSFDTNPLKVVAESPVSTFSIDSDTASYAYVRRALKEGQLPQPDTVRVEEMINYFPYDWKGPDSAATPFNTTVTVMPTPWNNGTKLLHVAIKGYDVKPVEQPKANLVFLIDVSGSMNEPDKLPLLRAAMRMLVNKLQPGDTVSIVTYAGEAGTVLEPTKVSDKAKILNAVEALTPGGSTAGEAGIREAYRLAQSSFVKGGVNRIMLATDGDFNVGQTDDGSLTRLVEEKRDSGVFLSVLGFGRGNLNDQMMQALAQNGNGTAAYIDTLQEAEKVLVEDASSTLFPIAKDVKIQVEFNPNTVSEYRLIGYETRALAREDFNNDAVDAGEIGSGHAVTAIYEITPKGSPAEQVDALRYGKAEADSEVGNGEFAFVKLRYKQPDGDVSKLITTPVTQANEVASFDAAGTDQRFSVAVAAFGQKLRHASEVRNFSFDQIEKMASSARGDDPFGYRTEFLSLVRLADAMGGSKAQ
ncbi:MULTISPECIES: vWA domain-containing protein [Mesorhizobium]|uniref:VWA domain-containing protein n=1 Tax=Mesorhizobium denitrificans TaxID=2294114 RepID=A0A371XFQ6_9HYPH|nr:MULTISPECIES: VWA domain-containing protein [Mesorhizobium]RFC68058.1 VWA domain-containing protein [Mesorhizobium denitrificans]